MFNTIVGVTIGVLIGSTLGSVVSYYVIKKLLMKDPQVREFMEVFTKIRESGFSKIKQFMDAVIEIGGKEEVEGE